jgi:hypothetical protein
VKPIIDGTKFGSITIAGEIYEKDVVIRLNGEIKKRKKKLSKERYGTSHKVSVEEAEYIFELGAKLLIVGTGQSGCLDFSKEAMQFFQKNGCSVNLYPTPQAVKAWNETKYSVIGMFHLTC